MTKPLLRRFLGLVLALAACLCAVTQACAATAWNLPIPMGTLPLATPGSIDVSKPAMRATVAVHRSPAPGSMVIGQLLDGTRITVLGTSGDYYRIDCHEMDGYLLRSLVTHESEGYRVAHRYGTPDSLFLTDRSIGDGILLRHELYSTAMARQGVPYVLGGTTPRGFDCSGFTQYVYRQNGIGIPRTCEEQLGAGLIVAKEELQCGDLILFTRTNHPTALVTHVGMYLGDGLLIHAGSGGITVVRLDSRYFTEHYLCARRVVPTREALQLPQACTAAEGAAITPRIRTK